MTNLLLQPEGHCRCNNTLKAYKLFIVAAAMVWHIYLLTTK